MSEAEKDVEQSDRKFLEEVEQFERQKVKDIKAMGLEFIHAQLLYHSRCLEIMSKAYAMFDGVNEEAAVKVPYMSFACLAFIISTTRRCVLLYFFVLLLLIIIAVNVTELFTMSLLFFRVYNCFVVFFHSGLDEKK